MNDENENVNQSAQQEQQNTDPMNNQPQPKKKPGLKDAIGKMFGNKKGSFFSSKLGNMIFAKYKFIIIAVCAVLLIIAAVIIAIGDDSSAKSAEYRQNGVSVLGINESSSKVEQEAVKIFDQYDSLIGFTTEQLDKIFQELLNNDNTKTEYVIKVGKKEVGRQDGINGSILDKRKLYEHIQRTEKYNFNYIKWTEFGHDIEEQDIDKQRNDSLELDLPKYAIDDDDTLITLLNLTSPYLLSNNIPLGILCGLFENSNFKVEEGETEKFIYEVEKEALTKMKASRYDLQKVTAHTYYDDYSLTPHKQTITCTLNDDGNYIVSSINNDEQNGEIKYEKTEEKRRGGYPDTYDHDIHWYVREAYTYDDIIKNEYNYTKYSDSDAQNLINPAETALVGTADIDEVIGKKYKVGDYYGAGGEDAPSSKTVSSSYTQKSGITYYYDKTWKDTLTATSSEVKEYTFDDLIAYNTKEDTEYSHMPTDKKLIEEEDFTNAKYICDLYKAYEKEDKATRLYGLSLIDFLNSNPSISETYLREDEEAFSAYMAYPRIILKEAYTQIKYLMKELAKKNGSEKILPFVYGKSLGFEVTIVSGVAGEVGNYVSGMDLLKQYIRSWEGAGEQPVTKNDEGIDCYVAYRDSGGLLTVGYGINLDAHANYKQQLEAVVGGTISEGTLVPVEDVDAIEDEIIKYYYDMAKNASNGLDLKEYQIHALASLLYNGIPVNDITKYYKDPYWNEEKDDKHDEVYEKYKDNQSAVSQIEAEADYTKGIYTEWWSKYTHDVKGTELPGLVRRRKSEYVLFSLGYYTTLQKFYTSGGGGNLAGIELLNPDNTINYDAALALQNFYEQEVFTSGGPTAAGSVNVGLGSSSKGNSGNVSSSHKRIQNFKSEYQHFFLTLAEGGKVRVNEYYQCTWWAESLGFAFLYNNSGGRFDQVFGTTSLGNGGDVARNIASQYGINLTVGAKSMVPGYHYIISTTGGQWGHVMYVEAVGKDEFVISHSGSGTDWYGVAVLSKDHPGFASCACVCLEELLEKVAN